MVLKWISFLGFDTPYTPYTPYTPATRIVKLAYSESRNLFWVGVSLIYKWIFWGLTQVTHLTHRTHRTHLALVATSTSLSTLLVFQGLIGWVWFVTRHDFFFFSKLTHQDTVHTLHTESQKAIGYGQGNWTQLTNGLSKRSQLKWIANWRAAGWWNRQRWNESERLQSKLVNW